MKPVDASRLDVTVTEAERCRRILDVVVPAELVDAERRAVSAKIAGRIKVRGFRKGKVPARVVKSRYGDLIEQQTVEELVHRCAETAIGARELKPISSAEVTNVKHAAGKSLSFRVSFDVQPEVSLGRVGGFSIDPLPDQPVGDDTVDRHLELLRQRHAVWKSQTEGTPETGDAVTVKLAVAGEDSRPGNEDEDEDGRVYEFVVGSEEALPDIQEAVRTLAPEESGEFDVEFPGNGEGEPPRQKRLKVKLLGRSVPELPELDNAFAQTVGKFESVDQLRDKVREDVRRVYKAAAENGRNQQLARCLVEANDFEVPESMVRALTDAMIGDADQVGEERLAALRTELRDQAEFAAKRELLFERIADEHGLRPSEEDLDAEVEAIAEKAGKSPSTVYAELQRSGRIDELQDGMTSKKVIEFLRRQSGLE